MPRKPSPKTELSYPEKRTLDFIRWYWAEHSYSPNLREISAHLNRESTSLARHYVLRLAEAGKIRYTERIARSIVIL